MFQQHLRPIHYLIRVHELKWLLLTEQTTRLNYGILIKAIPRVEQRGVLGAGAAGGSAPRLGPAPCRVQGWGLALGLQGTLRAASTGLPRALRGCTGRAWGRRAGHTCCCSCQLAPCSVGKPGLEGSRTAAHMSQCRQSHDGPERRGGADRSVFCNTRKNG